MRPDRWEERHRGMAAETYVCGERYEVGHRRKRWREKERVVVFGRQGGRDCKVLSQFWSQIHCLKNMWSEFVLREEKDKITQ